MYTSIRFTTKRAINKESGTKAPDSSMYFENNEAVMTHEKFYTSSLDALFNIDLLNKIM